LQPHDDSVKLVGQSIESLERRVSQNPALLSGWTELERLYRANGDTQKASLAARHMETLRHLPPALVAAGNFFSAGQMAAATRVLRVFLQENATHVEALRLLGRIALDGNRFEEAASLFERVLSASPHYRAARADFVRTLIQQQRHSQAGQEIAILLELEPDNWDYVALNGTALAGMGRHESAIAVFQTAVTAVPDWTHLYLLLGNSLKAIGRQQEAVDAYRAAAVRRPGFGDAYWSLANLKTYRFADDEISRMRAVEAAPVTRVVDRYHLCFALGKALEDRCEYEDSWRYYARGNALKAEQSPYDPLAMEREVDRSIETCSAEFMASHAGAGCSDENRTPIFIVGLPRSGSTLVEQILASHSTVEGTQELPTVGRIAREYASAIETSASAVGAPVAAGVDYRRMGARYLAETRAYTSRGTRFFIDKMPNNFRHIGLIHLILPTAKIIDVRRNPMACCVSNLKQLYAAGQEFTYTIDSLTRYYKSYLRLMNHWDAVLPNRVLHVSYEELVDDLETQVARLLRFCELEAQPGCLRFHRTDRSINTASSEQVRQPIFRRGLTNWKHFEPWLGPLREALA
jgi:tetratricopeptide (TPR) repeat protein